MPWDPPTKVKPSKFVLNPTDPDLDIYGNLMWELDSGTYVVYHLLALDIYPPTYLPTYMVFTILSVLVHVYISTYIDTYGKKVLNKVYKASYDVSIPDSAPVGYVYEYSCAYTTVDLYLSVWCASSDAYTVSLPTYLPTYPSFPHRPVCDD